MNTIKDYKNVAAINPLFEITLIKLTSLEDAKPIIKPKAIKPEPIVEEKPAPIVEPVKQPEPVVVEEVKPAPVIETPKEEPTPVLSEIKSIENVIYLKDAEREDNFEIDNNLMINVMVTSKKDIKTELLDGWKNIKKLSTHPTFGKAATLLIDGRPLVASNKIVILEYQIPKLAEKVNMKDVQAELQTVLIEVFHRQLFVYAVSRKESVEYQSLYMNLLQIGKLPKAKDIVLEFEGE